MVICSATYNSLASAYIGYGSWVGLCTATPPNTSNPGTSEAATTSSYARQNTTWGAVSAGVGTGTAVTIPVSSATYTYVLLASTSATNVTNMYDNNTITNVSMGAAGSIVVTPTYTQT